MPAGSTALFDSEGRPQELERTLGAALATSYHSVLRWSRQHVLYTPETVRQVLRQADTGNFGPAQEMYAAMLAYDAHAGSVADTRVNQVTSVPITIDPADESPEAEATADYCRDMLANLVGWPDAVEQLVLGRITGFKALEIEWYKEEGSAIPVALHYTIPKDWRWSAGTGSMAGLLYVDYRGAWRQAEQHKFMISSPGMQHISQRGVMRRLCGLNALKWVAMFAWASFVELFGVPRTITQVPDAWLRDENDERVKNLLLGLQELSSEAFAVISKEIEITMQSGSSTGEGKPQEKFLDWLNGEISKCVLGQTLTTETKGTTGTYSTAQIHERVKHDVGQADINYVKKVLKRDLLEPAVLYAFGPEWPVPIPSGALIDPTEQQEKIENLNMALDRDVPVSTEYVYLTYGIPRPTDDDELFNPTAQPTPEEQST
jgi:phage gp29-like protein